MGVITRELALKVAAKLKAQIKARPNSPHDMAFVFEKGRVVAYFGIRRGSRRDLGHDHIPRRLHISPHQTLMLGQCPMSRDEWLRILAEKDIP